MKTETIAEFLARGGRITKVEPIAATPNKDSVKITPHSGPATIITMDEADLYHGEQKVRKTKVIKNRGPSIDVSSLPEALRKKYIDGVVANEEDEEND